MAKKRARPPVLSSQALEMLSARFRALGDPRRLRILDALMQGECCVSDLVESTGLEQTCVSSHLIRLHAAFNMQNVTGSFRQRGQTS
jgi:DNA-binding transcriptional ArsR family regulator